MAKRVYDTVLASECDGWVCGETLKKAVRELIERFFEEGWLPDMICDLGCGGASVFEIKPTNFEYPPEGGEQILEIIVGKSDKWTITQAE